MSHILALQGPPNSGKTETLAQLYRDLKAKYPTAKVQILHTSRSDISMILQDVAGKVVGIESQGDPNSRLQQSLNELLDAACDIIFCACRTRGMTVEWVKELAPSHRVQFVPHGRSAGDYATANAEKATLLMRMAGL